MKRTTTYLFYKCFDGKFIFSYWFFFWFLHLPMFIFTSIDFSTNSNWFSVFVKNWNCRNVFRLNFGRKFISLNITFIYRKSLLIIDAVYLFISFQFFYSVYYLTLFCLVFDPKLGRFLRRTGQRTCIQNTEDPEGLTPFASTVSPAEYESALTCPGFTIFFSFRAFFFGMRPVLPDFVPSLYQSLIEWMHAIGAKDCN